MPPPDEHAPRGPGGAGGLVPAGLTEAQRQAVTAGDPLLCVLAGAGTGKTRVLTLRVARRVGDGTASPGHLLVCTFSRKAADELHQRLWRLGVGEEVRAGTFHRTALHLLRQHHADRGLPPPTVLDDRRALLSSVLSDGGRPGDRRGRRSPGAAQLETEIGWAKARMVGPDDYETAALAARRRPPGGAERVAELYHRYEEARRRRGALDLDDLLLTCADLLEVDRRYAAAVRWRFRHLFVDELQDVNPAQFRLLGMLLGDEPDLFVVGDPNQSVYGWNGADPGLLTRLPDLLPGMRVLRLDENHRCTPQVVRVAAAALGLEGPAAPTSTRPAGAVPRLVAHHADHDEATWVARQAWLARRPGGRWTQVAVLARTNAQLSVVATAMEAGRVPYQLAGGDLGPASDLVPSASPRPAEADRAGGADGAGTTGTGAGAGADTTVPPGGGVVLTTFHRAKGLQWPTVFVIGLVDGLVPIASARTPAAREEERRLLYVALTRAEDQLTCTWARHSHPTASADGSTPRRPSPWLAPVEQVLADLATEAAEPDPADVARRLAEIRRHLAAPPEAAPPEAAPPEAGTSH